MPGHLAARGAVARDSVGPRAPGARGWAWRLAQPVLAPSPASMRRIALAGVVASAGIIMTGAGVRLTQSGLGCPDWPRCTATSIVASGATGDPLIHRWVEFGNRLVTVAIFVIAVVVWVAAWRYRPDGRRRADLVWLASAQPAGIVGQAVLGGIVVLTNLDPVWVSFHFVFSMVLVAAAVALYVRCAEGRGPARLLVARELRLFALGAVAVLGVMIVAGTVVTGTGPLAGGRLPDGRLIPRFHLPLSGVTQFHADIGWLLAGLAIALVLGLRLTRAPRLAVRLGWVLLALIGAQGVIGYAQYFSGLPAGLVWVHVSDATLIWITAIRLPFALRDRGPLADGTVAGGTVADGTVAADALAADAMAADPRSALSPDAHPR
ncbi:MAG TPA: COX15/CtaA family protein [Streptosporangiaceae bacterium]|nr:COX15/CtaA family protein [Streptosporangiaceae bacterium]